VPRARNRDRQRVQVAIDEFTRLCDSEVLEDETGSTAAGFLASRSHGTLRQAFAFTASSWTTVSANEATSSRQSSSGIGSRIASRAPAARRPIAGRSASAARCSASEPTPRCPVPSAGARPLPVAGSPATTCGIATAACRCRPQPIDWRRNREQRFRHRHSCLTQRPVRT